MNRLILIAAIAALMIAPWRAHADSSAQSAWPAATVYKDPNCGCCTGYVEHLRASGVVVTVVDTADLMAVKGKHGIPDELQACHTTLIDGYVVEGHVPLASLRKLLSERPAITGISLPGMPAGSPGMPGTKTAPFEILTIPTSAEETPTLYAAE